MIELSKAHNTLSYTAHASYESEEKCSICENSIQYGSLILRETRTRKIICQFCIKVIKKMKT